MDSAHLHRLLLEAHTSARELLDIRRPITLSPGHLHALVQVLLNLTDTCRSLHTRNLALLVQAAARRERGDVV